MEEGGEEAFLPPLPPLFYYRIMTVFFSQVFEFVGNDPKNCNILKRVKVKKNKITQKTVRMIRNNDTRHKEWKK